MNFKYIPFGVISFLLILLSSFSVKASNTIGFYSDVEINQESQINDEIENSDTTIEGELSTSQPLDNSSNVPPPIDSTPMTLPIVIDAKIESGAVVLIDAKTGIIIYEKNKDIAKYPASITKILTSLVVLENTKLDERVDFSHNAVFTLPPGSSWIAMDEDESLTIEQCLYAILLASANEVSNAVAEHISTNNEGFAALLNERAKELGATNTNFVNPHGYHDERHYTTAYDMALIMREAIKMPKFIEIISTPSIKLPPTERQPLERPLNNSHKMIYPGDPHYYEYVVGGKTGFTDEAKNTLVTYAKKDNIELIVVVLESSNSNTAYTDTATLLDYGFDSYTDVEIFDANKYSETIDITFIDGDNITEGGPTKVYAKGNISLYLPSMLKQEDLIYKINPSYDPNKTIYENQEIGTLDIKYKDAVLSTVKLYSKSSVLFTSNETVLASKSLNSSSFFDGISIDINVMAILLTILKVIGVIFTVLLIIAVTARIYRYNKRIKRKKAKRRKLATARARNRNQPNPNNTKESRRSKNNPSKVRQRQSRNQDIDFRNYRYR